MTWDHTLTEKRAAAPEPHAWAGKEHGATHAGGWTDERVEQLKTLWQEGLSGAQIAALMGGGLTRNGVIGKIHRLKLQESRPPRPRRLEQPRPVRPPRERRTNPSHSRQEARRHQPGEPLPPDTASIRADAFEPLPGATAPIGILELTAHTCKWPIGDPLAPGFGYCGCAKDDTGPYCEVHARRAFVPLERKVRYRTPSSFKSLRLPAPELA